MNRAISRLVGIVLVGTFCVNQTASAPTKLIAYRDMPNDGKVYELIPGDADKSYKARMSPYFDFQEMAFDTSASGKDLKSKHTGQVQLYISGHSYVTKKGSKIRVMNLVLRSIPDEDKTIARVASLPLNDARLVAVKLHDLLRIGRGWRSEGTPKEDQRVHFFASEGLELSIIKSKGYEVLQPGLSYKGVNFVFRSLEDFSTIVTIFDEYLSWLEKQ